MFSYKSVIKNIGVATRGSNGGHLPPTQSRPVPEIRRNRVYFNN
jgi:hypothetical protein